MNTFTLFDSIVSLNKRVEHERTNTENTDLM